MLESPSFLFTVFAFLLVLGPLVLVHELGHYLVGRLFGVKADAFSIGFGKELAGWTDKRGTRWKLSLLPLGGYVQFAGDMNAASIPDKAIDQASPEERATIFHFKPLWQRALIVLAGPLTNLGVAVAIFAAFALIQGKAIIPPEVSTFVEKSDARAAGLKVGDRIVAVDGSPIENAVDIPPLVAPFPGRTISLTVEREGQPLLIPVDLTPQTATDSFGNTSSFADLGVGFGFPVVQGFATNSPAQAAGMKKGDRLLAIDGRRVDSHGDVVRAVSQRPGESITVEVRRNGDRLEFPVVLAAVPGRSSDGKEIWIGQLGVRVAGGEVVPVGPIEAIGIGVDRSIGIVRMMITGIGQIVTGERSVKELGGPVKIAKFSGEQLTLGWDDFTWFVGLISINLAFINLLPIPALDGGHLAFYAAEAVRRKPIGARGQEWAFRTGLAFVLALMLLVTINDLASLRVFGG